MFISVIVMEKFTEIFLPDEELLNLLLIYKRSKS